MGEGVKPTPENFTQILSMIFLITVFYSLKAGAREIKDLKNNPFYTRLIWHLTIFFHTRYNKKNIVYPCESTKPFRECD